MTREQLLSLVEKYKLGLKTYNISYYEIASVLGVHQNTIGNWLHGDSKTEKHFKELLDAYKILSDQKVKANIINADGVLIGKEVK